MGWDGARQVGAGRGKAPQGRVGWGGARQGGAGQGRVGQGMADVTLRRLEQAGRTHSFRQIRKS